MTSAPFEPGSDPDPVPETDPDEPADPPADDRVSQRATLLPEEASAGSDDPQAQAEAILAESDERVQDPEGTRSESTQTPGG